MSKKTDEESREWKRDGLSACPFLLWLYGVWIVMGAAEKTGQTAAVLRSLRICMARL